ncbi:D-tyrosyl-tRNA(Tyr) deacylase [archaeon]|nr:D-tyrosyl-tRNA(Tyr) deacylase [archaeon]|tara:strand:- start:2356 stop:3129 length:774 start_codon:yes stop_codon:yes gene_type:complete
MEYEVIISKKDPASMNIGNALKELDYHGKLHVIQERSIYSKDLDHEENFLIFATKHESTSLKKTLTVHNPGNWGKADLGGKDFNLPPSTASILKQAFLELKTNNNLDYETSGEATHHGPELNTPSLFIEIGSSNLQWKDPKAAEVIAKSIISLTSKKIPKYKTAIGIGGGHYMPSFNKVLERTNIALSYICPKHNLELLNEDLLQQAIKNTTEKVDFILLDWKGLGLEKEKIKKLTENLNLPVKRSQNVLSDEEFKL